MKKEVTVGGMPGEGPTVKDARQDAEAKIERLLRELTAGPEVVTLGAYAYLIWRDTHGWSARIVLTPQGLEPHRGCSTGRRTRDDAIWSAYNHMGQLSWSHDVADDRAWIEALTASLPAGPRLDHLREALAEDARVQRAYRVARAAGLDDSAAHAAARGAEPMPEPVVADRPTPSHRPAMGPR
jgi:hypothetical protein